MRRESCYHSAGKCLGGEESRIHTYAHYLLNGQVGQVIHLLD